MIKYKHKIDKPTTLIGIHRFSRLVTQKISSSHTRDSKERDTAAIRGGDRSPPRIGSNRKCEPGLIAFTFTQNVNIWVSSEKLRFEWSLLKCKKKIKIPKPYENDVVLSYSDPQWTIFQQKKKNKQNYLP